MLDIDTGGERLFALGRKVSPWPAKVAASESFQPNIVLARRRLNGLAVEVVSYTRPGRLPFGDREFELIINRHGRYSPREIRRILQPGGTFITEQVGSDMCTTLNRLLDAPGEATTRWDLRTASREMTEAGFTLLREQEHHGRDLFVDIGAICVVPHQRTLAGAQFRRRRILPTSSRDSPNDSENRDD